MFEAQEPRSPGSDSGDDAGVESCRARQATRDDFYFYLKRIGETIKGF